MKPFLKLKFFPGLLLAVMLLAGCGRQEGGGHARGKQAEHDEAHGHGHDHGHAHGHGHREESPSGASFKAGKGVIVTDETKTFLGVEVADLVERQVSNQLRFTIQVFGEQHHHRLNPEDHSGCDVQGSGLLSTNAAALVRAGQAVQLGKDTNSPLGGVVLAVKKALALGESEIVIGISNATAVLKAGEFVPARVSAPRAEVVPAIPEAAVLRTSEGAFVYAVNGDAYLRTAIKTGAEADGWVEITDGLLAGDQVVTKPVQTLWLIELRATKGGGHSH